MTNHCVTTQPFCANHESPTSWTLIHRPYPKPRIIFTYLQSNSPNSTRKQNNRFLPPLPPPPPSYLSLQLCTYLLAPRPKRKTRSRVGCSSPVTKHPAPFLTQRHGWNFQTSRWLCWSSGVISTWAQSARVSTFISSAISSRIPGSTRSPGDTT